MGIVKQPYPWLIENSLWKAINKTIDATDVSGVIFISDGYYRVREVWETHSVAAVAGTLQVEVLTSGQDADAGVDQLSSAIDLTATADTPQQGTVIATPTMITPGDMVGLVMSATKTNFVNGLCTVYLERIQPSLG